LATVFGIDPIPLRKRSKALFTILYRSTDCLCRRGASVENLAHSASFHSKKIMHHQMPGLIN
jgi:hypothetical protein